MSFYTKTFFDGINHDSVESATIVLSSLFDLAGVPKSMLDLGCGSGQWLSAAGKLGVDDLLGTDGDYVDRAVLQIPADKFEPRDLTKPVDFDRRFDLVASLEVGEHLDAQYASTLIDSISAHGDLVLFSAAIPGQGGTHHVNEQWPSYWIPMFEDRGYELFDVIRPALWGNERVEYWYRQNALVFARGDAATRLRESIRRTDGKDMGGVDAIHSASHGKSPWRVAIKSSLPEPVLLLAGRLRGVR